MGFKNIDPYTFKKFDLIHSCLSVMLGALHYFQGYKQFRPEGKQKK
jgi:hypothetical protein